jgi:translation initiation factor IF-3
LDLVEVSPMARPPVCKIMDYGKYKYELQKKKHEQKKKQAIVHIKEIKMRPSTDEHDFQTKLRHIRRFLEDGDKVKVSLRFKGREMAHIDLGHERMKRILDELKGLVEVESMPKMEARQLFMMLAPAGKKKESTPQAAGEAEVRASRPLPLGVGGEDK